jgi:PAS domain-containing protein
MTRRDLQRAMGDEKKPWEIGKSFDRSAPIGPLHPALAAAPLEKGAIWLKVNGATKQNANLNQMIWKRGRADQQAVRGVRADARGHHLLRHSGERRPGGQGRRHRVPHRRTAESQRQGRVKANDRGAQLVRAALDTLEFGFAVFDRHFKLVASNKAFRTLRAYPPALVKPGTELVDLFRYNARRGDYGDGDVEAIAMARLELMRSPFSPRAHDTRRTRAVRASNADRA